VPDHFFLRNDEMIVPNAALALPSSPVLQEEVTVEKHWSDIFSLSDPRYIVTGKHLLLPTNVIMIYQFFFTFFSPPSLSTPKLHCECVSVGERNQTARSVLYQLVPVLVSTIWCHAHRLRDLWNVRLMFYMRSLHTLEFALSSHSKSVRAPSSRALLARERILDSDGI
jgi:hypothetical protein